MPKIAKSSTKKPTAKTKKVAAVVKKATKVIKKNSTPEIKVKAPIKISKTYIPKETEKYMCDKHLSFFKINLLNGKKNW
jgi:DnaK suppressor protein